MKHIAVEELVQATPILTRGEKLREWARICRGHPFQLFLLNGLEFAAPFVLQHTRVNGIGHCAMSLAASHEKFQQAGLSENATIWELMKFMEITQGQLHEFSCDCGGHITNDEQARRIEGLAG